MAPLSKTAGEILSKALASAAKEAAESAAKLLLGGGLGPAAGPAARVLGEAAKALVAALLDETAALEAKLDRLLREPFRTGSAGILEALAVGGETAEEGELRSRRLHAALDRLACAHTLAEGADGAELRAVIRMYQALGYALLPGGGRFAGRCLRQLVATLASQREAAVRLEAEADAESPPVKAPPPMAGAAFLRRDWESPGALDYAQEYQRRALAEQRASLRARAAELRAQACDLGRFGSFILSLSASRRRPPAPRRKREPRRR